MTGAAGDPLDEFELPGGGAASHVLFGSVDAAAVTMSSSTSDRRNDITTAELALDAELARGVVIDTPLRWAVHPARVTALVAGLRDSPVLRTVDVAALFGIPPATTGNGRPYDRTLALRD